MMHKKIIFTYIKNKTARPQYFKSIKKLMEICNYKKCFWSCVKVIAGISRYMTDYLDKDNLTIKVVLLVYLKLYKYQIKIN